MSNHNDDNALIYVLAGVGLGAIIGAAAGLLFAPKAGTETQAELAEKFKELKSKTDEWIAEQKNKKPLPADSGEVGA